MDSRESSELAECPILPLVVSLLTGSEMHLGTLGGLVLGSQSFNDGVAGIHQRNVVGTVGKPRISTRAS